MTELFPGIGDPTDDFLARGKGDASLNSCVRDLQLPGAGARYPAIALPRPLFASQESVIGLARDVSRLIDLLTSLPERFFGHSVDAYLAAQHNSAERTALWRRGSTGSLVKIGRVDSFLNGQDFQIIEMNLGSVLGGLGVAKLNRGLLRERRFGAFADVHALGYEDPLEMIVRKVRALAASVTGDDDPVVALVEDALGTSSQGAAVAEDLNALGLKVINSDLRDVGWQQGKITIADGKQPVDVAIRFFILDDLVNADGRSIDMTDKMDMLVRAHDGGQTALFCGTDIDMHSSKASLAVLYESEVWQSLSEPERDLVRRRVPWTRLLGQVPAAGRNETRSALLQECIERREELVLKPANLALGSGVLLGSDTAEQQWRAMVENPDRPDYVVQQRIVPKPEVIVDPASGQPEEWDVNWGIYFSDEEYNGTWVRARRTKEKGIIGLNEGTRPGCAFTY